MDTLILEKIVSMLTIMVSMLTPIVGNAPSQRLGATFDVPTSVALFSTTLASPITSSATSMTLTSATYNNGASTLASSTYAFIIDEGSSNQEFVLADCTSTACTNMTRGLDMLTGTTTVASLQFAHRRGASVKITDGPQMMIITRMLNGQGLFPNKLTYKTAPTFTSGNDIINKTYADSLSYAGAPDASVTVKGVSEIATDTEVASSTSSGGTTAPLVIRTTSATSTYNSATAGLKVVVTQNNGKIDPNFYQSNDHTWTGINTFNTATTTFNATTTFSGSVTGATLFGGDGSDGALTITSGTTTVALGGVRLFVKNYSSISITSTGSLAFSGAHASGTVVILKSKGAVTITSSYIPGIDVSGLGTAGGTGSTPSTGSASTGTTPTAGVAGGVSSSVLNFLITETLTASSSAVGGGASGTANAGQGGGIGQGTTTLSRFNINDIQAKRLFELPVGVGGGGGSGGGCSNECASGCTGTNGTSLGGGGGVGGAGGGALYIEAGGDINLTGATIWAKGINGTAGTQGFNLGNNGGGGGGGGGNGGSILILYGGTLTGTPTINVNGGTGAAGGAARGTGQTGVTGSTGLQGAYLLQKNRTF